MKWFHVKYLVLVAAIMLGFANFVACGAQLYKVSMKDDTHNPESMSAASSDPSSNAYGLHAPNGWDNLPIHFRVGYTMNEDQLRGLTLAMRTWEIAVGRKLFSYDGVHQNMTGDSFPDLYSSLPDGINGQYLDNDWAKTGKADVVLATTIWDNQVNDTTVIKTADIRFNNHFYVLGDSFVVTHTDTREVVDMQTLATHELGHMLGLAHVSATVDSQSIMTASLYIGEGLANRRISRGDVERIQKIYGCQGSLCDIDKIIAKIDALDTERAQPAPAAKTQLDTVH